MILQALKEYYDRKAADPESGIASAGFEKKEFRFLIVIDRDGQVINLEDTREQVGKRLVGKVYTVPRSKSRAGPKGYQTTFLLWDHSGYLLAHPKSDKPSDREQADLQHKTWLAALAGLPRGLKADEGVAAILHFYEGNGVENVKTLPNWPECAAILGVNMTFRLAGDAVPIPWRPAVQAHVRSLNSGETVEGSETGADVKVIGRCLVTGEVTEIVRIHGRTPINKDTKSLVALQDNSGYDSYGKTRGYNAPVGKAAEFAYTTALNTLLKADGSRMRVGDATVVFWVAGRTESGFEDFFGELWRDDPDRNSAAVRSLFAAPQSGAFATDSDSERFYVLGLAPNAARMAVRLWIAGTVSEMATQVRSHFNDLRMVHGPKQRETLSLGELLKSTAVQRDPDNIPPNLAGETMRAILAGSPYPQTLLQAAVRRIRAERARAEHEVTYARASLIKACINRATRFKDNNQKEELKVSLDADNMNIGYRLGRLFAALEKIQKRAFTSGGGREPESTILDRYYGSASGAPVTVFGTLIRLSKHHLAKIESEGERRYFEKTVGEIMSGIGDFPPHLPLADQGRFAIGYYHQMQDFYTKKSEEQKGTVRS